MAPSSRHKGMLRISGYLADSIIGVRIDMLEVQDEVIKVEATSAVIGRDFNITCSVQNWNDDVTFIHNNVVVDTLKDWRYDLLRYVSEDDEVINHILMVTGATEDDEGTYECYTSPSTYRSVFVPVWKLANVQLELQSNDRPNWKDSPVPINCVVEGTDPDAIGWDGCLLAKDLLYNETVQNIKGKN
ncbi:hypothetical protein SK128_019875 [Halocaridina rubra]|uniref:Ig-like domain-containing protein n=1 Tax=Halocaridina rubra TaxID=373956 RepID=A0AAN8XEP0_HALRR